MMSTTNLTQVTKDILDKADTFLKTHIPLKKDEKKIDDRPRTEEEIENEIEEIETNIDLERKAIDDCKMLLIMYENCRDDKGKRMVERKINEIQKNLESLEKQKEQLEDLLPKTTYSVEFVRAEKKLRQTIRDNWRTQLGPPPTLIIPSDIPTNSLGPPPALVIPDFNATSQPPSQPERRQTVNTPIAEAKPRPSAPPKPVHEEHKDIAIRTSAPAVSTNITQFTQNEKLTTEEQLKREVARLTAQLNLVTREYQEYRDVINKKVDALQEEVASLKELTGVSQDSIVQKLQDENEKLRDSKRALTEKNLALEESLVALTAQVEEKIIAKTFG